MASESKGNFIMISPHERMNDAPIAIFYIDGVSEEDRTEYYPIMSNYYDTVLWSGTGNLRDINNNSVPPQALQDYMVSRIEYGGIIYWMSNVNDGSLKYCDIESGGTDRITISTTDNWNTYTVAFSGEV